VSSGAYAADESVQTCVQLRTCDSIMIRGPLIDAATLRHWGVSSHEALAVSL
jgi:hypothetical protein